VAWRFSFKGRHDDRLDGRGVTQLQVTGDDGLTRLDVFVVEGEADPGDSGAPVLPRARDRIAGIQFGRDTVGGTPVFTYSWWPNISTELSGSAFGLHSAPPLMLGYLSEQIDFGGCYDPDARRMYLIFGYPHGSAGSYEFRYRELMGTTPYYTCGWSHGDYQQSSYYQSCTAHFGGDCPCVSTVVGGGPPCA
jgi:hypothetical protein